MSKFLSTEKSNFLCLFWHFYLQYKVKVEQLPFLSLHKIQAEANLWKCVKSRSEWGDGAIFDGSVGIVLLRDCTTGLVGRLAPIHVSARLLITRTIPCWAIGSLGLLGATPSMLSCCWLLATRPWLAQPLSPGGETLIHAVLTELHTLRESMSRPDFVPVSEQTFQLSGPLAAAC